MNTNCKYIRLQCLFFLNSVNIFISYDFKFPSSPYCFFSYFLCFFVCLFLPFVEPSGRSFFHLDCSCYGSKSRTKCGVWTCPMQKAWCWFTLIKSLALLNHILQWLLKDLGRWTFGFDKEKTLLFFILLCTLLLKFGRYLCHLRRADQNMTLQLNDNRENGITIPPGG